MILDARDEEIRHGYCFRDVRRLAAYAAHRSYWQRAMSAQDRFDLAVSAIAEFVLTAEQRPGEQELVTAGIRTINRDVEARLRQEGNDSRKPADGQEPNMANFRTYWWPYTGHVSSHDNGIVEVIAMLQILPRLKPVHRNAIVALARHGTYGKAAESLGQTRVAYVNSLYRARKEFRRFWHEGERPSSIWGHDFFGIEGYERDENITVRTLRQRKRRKRREIDGHSRDT